MKQTKSETTNQRNRPTGASDMGIISLIEQFTEFRETNE